MVDLLNMCYWRERTLAKRWTFEYSLVLEVLIASVLPLSYHRQRAVVAQW